MKTTSRTTKWRIAKKKSPGLGSSYHHPERTYNWDDIDMGMIRRVTISRLSSICEGCMIPTLIDDAVQEALLSVASGRSVWAGVTRALDKWRPLRKSGKRIVQLDINC